MPAVIGWKPLGALLFRPALINATPLGTDFLRPAVIGGKVVEVLVIISETGVNKLGHEDVEVVLVEVLVLGLKKS